MTTVSGFLEMKGFEQLLEGHTFFGINELIRLKAAVMHVVDAAGENSERLGHLQHFSAVFDCPVERAVCDEVWSIWQMNWKDQRTLICSVVARFVDR